MIDYIFGFTFFLSLLRVDINFLHLFFIFPRVTSQKCQLVFIFLPFFFNLSLSLLFFLTLLRALFFVLCSGSTSRRKREQQVEESNIHQFFVSTRRLLFLNKKQTCQYTFVIYNIISNTQTQTQPHKRLPPSNFN